MKTKQHDKGISRQLEEIQTFLKLKDQKPLNFVEAAQYLSISQSTLYKLTYQRKIPCHKPNGKYLYFFKHELDEWIVKSNVDTSAASSTSSEHRLSAGLGVMRDELKRKKKAAKENSVKNSDASAALIMTNDEEEEPP